MTERRFNEEEVAAIFERATEAQQTGRRQLPSGEGMTLGDLQAIGGEVGISSDLIAQAANAIDRGGRPTSRSFLGLQVGVGRTVDLGRKLTDDEWERLVVDLRDTFDARGTLRHDGALRQWTNGNLQVLLEPGATGDRIRLRTVKGNSLALMSAGIASLGIAVTMQIATMLFPGVDPGAMSSLAILSTVGVGMFGIGALRLRGWARTRQRQMEEIAARVSLPPTSSNERLGGG